MRMRMLFRAHQGVLRKAAFGIAVAIATSLFGGQFASAAVSFTDISRRTALVIGNTDYNTLPPLPGSIDDARRVKALLRDANFEVIEGENLTKLQMEATIRRFLAGLNSKDVALIYYSGHAIQVGGDNYMLPVDARLKTAYDLQLESYRVGDLLRYLAAASGTQILILDAARENPVAGAAFNVGPWKHPLATATGLAPLEPADGALVVYPTKPDMLVPRNGPTGAFASALVRNGEVPGLEIGELLRRIREQVSDATQGRQVPWDVSRIGPDFRLMQRHQLVIMDPEQEVRASAQAQSVALDLAPPLVSGLAQPSVIFTTMPAHGVLLLDGREIRPESRLGAEELSRLTYRRHAGDDASTDTASYALATDAGLGARCTISIVFDPSIPAPEPKLKIVAAEDSNKPSPAKPIEVAFAAEAGTGFVPMPDSGEEPAEGWMRLAESDPDVQVVVGSTAVGPGDLIPAGKLAELRVRPSLAIKGASARIALAPAGKAPNSPPPMTITVDLGLNRCDELAGEPLDVQGVAKGRLPNEIDVPAARQACAEAVAKYPEVGRFHYEYARALYAAGELDQAVAQLTAAEKGGHVRAGYLLGRLYQLGAGVKQDPSKAIPLFEAAARRGDPYAQQGLGRALIDGNGTAVDAERGIALYAQAAEAGHTYAMNALGAAYLYGQHVDKDPKRALRFFQESADRQDVWGYVNLGLMYRDGVAVPADKQRARELFEKANAAGHPYAGTLLGMMQREEGAGPKETVELFRTSASRGDAWGALYAAQILGKNPDLAKDDGEAVRLLALAVSQDTPKVSDQARAELNRSKRRPIRSEIRKALQRSGLAEKETAGPVNRANVERALGPSAPRSDVDVLVALIRREWIASRPRLDML